MKQTIDNDTSSYEDCRLQSVNEIQLPDINSKNSQDMKHLIHEPDEQENSRNYQANHDEGIIVPSTMVQTRTYATAATPMLENNNHNYASNLKEYLDSEAGFAANIDAARLNKNAVRIESRLTAGISNEEAPTPMPAGLQDN